METISVTVTQALLKKAIRHSRKCCLVALLLREATGHTWAIGRHFVDDKLVGYRAIDCDDAHAEPWNVSPPVAALIALFDASWERDFLLGKSIQIPARLVPQPEKEAP